jgi:hypothetical protein
MKQGRLYPIMNDLIKMVNDSFMSRKCFTFAMNYFIILNIFNGEPFPYAIDNRPFNSL